MRILGKVAAVLFTVVYGSLVVVVLFGVILLVALSFVKPASGNAATEVAASASAISSAVATVTNHCSPEVFLNDSVYLHKIYYHHAVRHALRSTVQLYVKDDQGMGMSLKEYIRRHIPEYRAICVIPNPRENYFTIYFTR